MFPKNQENLSSDIEKGPQPEEEKEVVAKETEKEIEEEKAEKWMERLEL